MLQGIKSVRAQVRIRIGAGLSARLFVFSFFPSVYQVGRCAAKNGPCIFKNLRAF